MMHFGAMVFSQRRTFLRFAPGAAFRFALGTAFRGVGQAGLATIGGLVSAQLAHTQEAATPVTTLAWFGVGAIVAKTLGAALAVHVGKSEVGKMGARLRSLVLRSLLTRHTLRATRQMDHGANGAGVLLQHLTDHVREVEEAIHAGLLRSIMSTVEVVCLLGALLAISPRMTLWAFLFFSVLALPVTRMRQRLRTSVKETITEQTRILSRVDETVHALDLLRVFGAGNRTAQRLEHLAERLAQRQAWIATKSTLLSGANELAAGLALIALLTMLSDTPSNTLLRFFIAMVLCYRPLRDLGDARAAMLRGAVALGELQPYLAHTDSAAHTQTVWQEAELQVRDLRIASAAAPWSFTLRPGDRLALRGATGAGKTTFLRTLLGLAQTDGVVRYGETQLDTATPVDARPFAWLPQDAPVLLGSVRDNLRPHDEQAIAHVALPLPFEGDLTERALSGGERQLLGLARALESEAPVLLLDEPTSALDASTKQWVLDVLGTDSRTMIIATHDEDVLRIATHIAEISPEGALQVFEKRDAESAKVA